MSKIREDVIEALSQFSFSTEATKKIYNLLKKKESESVDEELLQIIMSEAAKEKQKIDRYKTELKETEEQLVKTNEETDAKINHKFEEIFEDLGAEDTRDDDVLDAEIEKAEKEIDKKLDELDKKYDKLET